MTKLYVVKFGARVHPEEGKTDVLFSEKLEDAARYTFREEAQGDCNYLSLIRELKVSISGRKYAVTSFGVEDFDDGQFAISCQGLSHN